MNQIPDAALDAVTFTPNPGSTPLVRVEHYPDDVVGVLFGSQDWDHLRYWASALAGNSGGAFDGTGFALDTDELDPGEEPFSGVQLFAPWGDEVLVSLPAFERLLARFYGAVVAATRPGDPAREQPWWPAFLDDVQTVRRRAEGA